MTPVAISQVSSSSRLSGFADEQVVEFARAGSSQATEYLLQKYKGFVDGKAWSYFLVGAETYDVHRWDDRPLQAIRDFQADKLAHFSFAELCVTRQIITVLSDTRNKHEFSTTACRLRPRGTMRRGAWDFVADTCVMILSGY